MLRRPENGRKRTESGQVVRLKRSKHKDFGNYGRVAEGPGIVKRDSRYGGD